MTERIAAAHRASRGSCGAPRVHAVPVRGDARAGRRRVARLMRQAAPRRTRARAVRMPGG
ncbi:IS3 family transposase [Uniformispora flossi]|uniref:IS3 family transposase n=1 Tax=Uniformispora flossi TaxID=3390723 RepID=UPI003D05BFD1